MRTLILLTLLLTACTRQNLEVFIDSIDADDLASNHVDTPDLNRLTPDMGQKLVITWNLSRSWAIREIRARVRFHNHEETLLIFPLTHFRGVKVYELINEDYCAKGGIATYLVELYQNDELLDTVQHTLWCDLITVGCENDHLDGPKQQKSTERSIKALQFSY